MTAALKQVDPTEAGAILAGLVNFKPLRAMLEQDPDMEEERTEDLADTLPGYWLALHDSAEVDPECPGAGRYERDSMRAIALRPPGGSSHGTVLVDLLDSPTGYCIPVNFVLWYRQQDTELMAALGVLDDSVDLDVHPHGPLNGQPEGDMRGSVCRTAWGVDMLCHLLTPQEAGGLGFTLARVIPS